MQHEFFVFNAVGLQLDATHQVLLCAIGVSLSMESSGVENPAKGLADHCEKGL
jgi:hypothetical protein